MIQSKFIKRPQTSKHRNESQIHLSDEPDPRMQQNIKFFKKRPQSYKGFSRMSQFMNDEFKASKVEQKVHYKNIIQNTDKQFTISKGIRRYNEQQQHKFQQFLCLNNNKMYKPLDQFTQFSDSMVKNSGLLRRSQFNTPTNSSYQKFKQSNLISQTLNSRFYTKTNKSKYQSTCLNQNTFYGSKGFQKSIKDKSDIKKEKKIFQLKIKKNSRVFNKTFIGHVQDFQKLYDQQRQPQDNITLHNALDRILKMENMKKQMNRLTQTFI